MQVVPRKKTGDLARTIGVRLDKPIFELVLDVAERSALARREPGNVLRTIVTHWVLQNDELLSAYEEIWPAVEARRRAFEAGYADAARAIEAVGKNQNSSPRKRKKRRAGA